MRLINKMADTIRNGLRSFLQITPPQQTVFQVAEQTDYYGNAAINRIWARGDASEIQDMYKLMPGTINRVRFWAAVPTEGNDINKLHTGLPKLMRRVLTDIVISDMGEISVDGKWESIWADIAEDSEFEDILEEALGEILTVGDGAFRIILQPELSELPIIEFVSGDCVEYVTERGRLKEIIFRTVYAKKEGTFTLEEHYGRNYVRAELLKGGRPVPLDTIKDTELLNEEVTFEGGFMMAARFMAFKSDKYKDRGASIFDGKADAFDSLDESWSQWMDALRRGRSREYIPENMLPINPNTGEIQPPNAFDNAYIRVSKPMQEGSSEEIEVKQPAIPHDSYLATYSNALDLALQGVLSPSTLGIDIKKLDNAEAQREKEKVTLYTRNKLVQAIQKTIPKVVDIALKSYMTLNRMPLEKVTAEVAFGEYANPSFESQVETVGKAKTQGIMSTEACVDEMYGDSKDENWKSTEVARIKAEQGIVQAEEPHVSMDAEGFSTGFGG